MAIDNRLQVFNEEGQSVDYDILASDVKFFPDGKDLPTKLAEMEEEIGEGGYTPPQGGIPKTDLAPSVQQTLDDVANKVDKVNGKGLSTNDYTTEEKSKLGNLPTADQLTQQLGGKANDNAVVKSVTVNGTAQQKDTNGNVNVVVPDTSTLATKQEMADAIDDALGEAQVTVVPANSVGVIASLGSDSDEDALSASMGKKLKVAVLTILNALGTYAFPEGKPVIDWGDDSPVTYTVQKTIGIGLSATGGDTDVALGDSLEVSIAITNNMYIVDDDSVVVTMGGSPVVGAWNASTMKVTIAAVTGNVVINVPSMTYVGYGEQNSPLVFNLDGKNRGNNSGHWVDLAGNVDFILTNCTENSDNVEFNGTSSKGVSSGSLNVRYDEGTIESVFDLSASDYPTSIQNIFTNKMDCGISVGLGKGAQPDTSKSCYSYINVMSTTSVANSGVLGFDNVIKTKQQVCFYKSNGFRNGVALNDGRPSGQIAFTIDSTTQLSIGWRHRSSSDNYMKGKIFMVRVYNRVLTATERAQNYKVDKKRFNLS